MFYLYIGPYDVTNEDKTRQPELWLVLATNLINNNSVIKTYSEF